jgi:hypothetical protein
MGVKVVRKSGRKDWYIQVCEGGRRYLRHVGSREAAYASKKDIEEALATGAFVPPKGKDAAGPRLDATGGGRRHISSLAEAILRLHHRRRLSRLRGHGDGRDHRADIMLWSRAGRRNGKGPRGGDISVPVSGRNPEAEG